MYEGVSILEKKEKKIFLKGQEVDRIWKKEIFGKLYMEDFGWIVSVIQM